MGMLKDIEMPSGQIAGYHKVTRPGEYNFLTKTGTVFIGSYIDKAARTAGKGMVDKYDYPVQVDLSALPDPVEFTRPNIYVYLSSIPGGVFENATNDDE